MTSLIKPGLTICSRCRARDAVVTLEPFERWAEDLCFECVDVELERIAAAAVDVTAADLIAVARDELELGRAAPAVRERAEKISTSAATQSKRRCWAILPDGTRCRRRATAGRYGAETVCETHRHGCRLPGLGWRDGIPQGVIVEGAKA